MPESDYELFCERGHRIRLDPSELEDLIRSGEHFCPRCKRPLSLEGELDLRCRICSMIHTVSSLDEAQHTMDDSCGACPTDFGENSIHVPRSWDEHVGEYEWMRSGRDPNPLKRRGRSDYWEGLIHFCTVEEFAAIYADGRVKASGTGYFREPAVCLTEATFGNWAELQKRHGAFGYVFRKRDVLACGGGPALYLPKRMIASQKAEGGFCDDIRPFVNLLRIPSLDPQERKHDFLHEREWRVPDDISLADTDPFGVIINWKDVTRQVRGWRNVFGAAMQYEELNGEGDGSEQNE